VDFIFQHKELSGVSPLFSHPGQNPPDYELIRRTLEEIWSRRHRDGDRWPRPVPGPSTDNTLFVQQGLSSPKTVRISNLQIELSDVSSP